MNELDKVIHQTVRTRIMAHLINVGQCDYTALKNTLALSDGHMSTHMKELLGAGYVEMKKTFVDNKPKTTYKVTKEGKKRFAEYVNTLKALIAMK
ncbi:MAG: transcriptional regulator [Elusimicrobia bacterium]|nr:transcriptional regulator [Elusimicrobiota bacterium]